MGKSRSAWHSLHADGLGQEAIFGPGKAHNHAVWPLLSEDSPDWSLKLYQCSSDGCPFLVLSRQVVQRFLSFHASLMQAIDVATSVVLCRQALPEVLKVHV